MPKPVATLLLCEKPDAASRVARALDRQGQPTRQQIGGVPYFECETSAGPLFVCSALGHLYTLNSKGKTPRRFYPVWDYQWRPKNEVEPKKSSKLKAWITAINSLAKRADRFINACDYDVEGALMGFQILRQACDGADAKALRMKFSTMTEKELQEAYAKLGRQLDYGLAQAGQCRHELDWLYGINLSRVLTESVVKSGKGYAILSTGRVQSPTLRFVVQRETEVGGHVPIPFWTIDASIKHGSRTFALEYTKERIDTLAEAKRIVDECTDAILTVKKVESWESRQNPPVPFDLSTLQAEAYRNFGYTPSRTLRIAERLYLNALISYPRTSSQKLPPDIGYEKILQQLSERKEYSELVEHLRSSNIGELRPTQGIKDDPAHPAIYPTGETRFRLIDQEAHIFDLIARRFLSNFATPAVRESQTMTLMTGEHAFFLHGTRLIDEGWIQYYAPYVRYEERALPNLKEGSSVEIYWIKSLEKYTQPPARYNPASLLQKMERENLGTKATRADIIEILYQRGYVREHRMIATPLAIHIVDMLEQYCPLIIDAGFTSRLEGMMDDVEAGRSSRGRVILDATDHLRRVMFDLIRNEGDVGDSLGNAVVGLRTGELTFTSPCPECGEQLRIVRSKKTGKRFIGHSGHWEGARKCGFSAPLPQFGKLTILSKNCPVCGFQMVQAKSPRRRLLVSCPRCYARKIREQSGRESTRTESSASLATSSVSR